MSNSILIFTGAGASAQFNKPTTKEFKLQLSKKYKDSGLIQSFLDCPGFEDIEHVLESLKDFELSHNSHLMKYLKNATLPGIEQNTGEFFTTLARERDNIKSDIIHDLFSTYKWNESENDKPASKFYGKLFDIVGNYSSKIYVGTTNYDQAIEQACSLSNLKYECIDGFEHYRGDTSIWNGKKFSDEFNGQGKPVYLYKVHGSLNWKNDGSGNIVKNNRDIGYDRGSGLNILIAPTLSPKTAQEKEPYATLLSELQKKLESADICIIIGFSFRDQHISKPFQKFINDGKTFIVISPEGFDNYCDELFNDEKFNSSEARVAWFRKHRSGKKLHFIDKHVGEANNETIFKELDKILKSNSGGIKEEIDSQIIKNYSCDITFDELEDDNPERAKMNALKSAEKVFELIRSKSNRIIEIDIPGRGIGYEFQNKEGVVRITKPSIPHHSKLENCQFAQMHIETSNYDLLSKILNENSLMYWDFKWELSQELDVVNLIPKIKELTGKNPFSSSTSHNGDLVGGNASYSLVSTEGVKVATTISGTKNGANHISITCINRKPKKGFYTAHQNFSPGKIMSILFGEATYIEIKNLVDRSTEEPE